MPSATGPDGPRARTAERATTKRRRRRDRSRDPARSPGDLALALVAYANVLVELERLHEAAPLLPQLGASDVSDADVFFDELAAARGDWASTGRRFLAGAQSTHSPGLKGMLLRHIAIALAWLGADEDALERLGPERAAHAARRGVALPEGDSTTRAAEMVQSACVT